MGTPLVFVPYRRKTLPFICVEEPAAWRTVVDDSMQVATDGLV
jgi:hypothetical protein